MRPAVTSAWAMHVHALRALEEFDPYSEDNLPTIEEAKFLMNVSRATAIVHVSALPHLTVAQGAKQDQLWQAFEKVITARKAQRRSKTRHLAALLDLAADA